MTRDQRNQLFLEARDKELRLTNLAQAINCSPSLLSKYFSHKCNLSPNKEQKLINLIRQARQYEWRKVYID